MQKPIVYKGDLISAKSSHDEGDDASVRKLFKEYAREIIEEHEGRNFSDKINQLTQIFKDSVGVKPRYLKKWTREVCQQEHVEFPQAS